jgi:hypothetical protein
MSTQTPTQRQTLALDLDRLVTAIEQRDADDQLAFYGDEAQVRLVDRNSPPRTPQLLTGRAEIRTWIDDVSGRDMTHRVESALATETGVALIELCTYPDGTQVVCSCIAELAGGLITRQTVVQVWDE